MKKVSLLLCLALAGVTATAQETSGVSTEAGRKTTFARNGFWDNWFVGAGAGGSVYFGANDKQADFLDRITVNPSVFVGKWYNPYLGARLRVQGGSIHTFEGDQGQKMYRHHHVNVIADVMFNATNYFGKYNENRFYNLIPTAGFGYGHRFENKFNGRGYNGLQVQGGLLNTFRISNRLSAYAEFTGAFVERRFDRGPLDEGQMHWNGIGTATAGLMLKVGKVGFSEAVLQDQGLVNDLNNQINKLRKENDDLRNRKPNCPPATPCPPATTAPVTVAPETYVPNVVFFRLGSANIDNNQEVSIYNTAQYLNANPDAKVKIVGYADKLTGTAAYNLKLSERRAKNVAKVLTEKYKINSNRVAVEWKGSSEQPYKENAWNRVAIFFAQ